MDSTLPGMDVPRRGGALGNASRELRKLAECVRDLCPREGDGLTVEIRSSGREPVTLTAETRKRIERLLRGDE